MLDPGLVSAGQNCVAWLALGGLPCAVAELAAAVARRRGVSMALGVARLAAVGACALVAAAWPHWGLRVARPVDLEHWAGHLMLGPSLRLVGLCGLFFAVARGVRARISLRDRGLQLAALAPVALVLPWAFLPPWAPDEGIYHLSLPLHALIAGGSGAPPGHGNGGYFALGDAWASLGLWMGSVPAARGAQLWPQLFAGQTLAAALPHVVRRRVVLAQWLWLASPVVLWQLGCAYVDVTQAAFEVAGAVLLAQGLQSARPNGVCVAAAWMCGCACACKATSLAILPAFACVLLVRAAQAARAASTAAVPSLSTGAGWAAAAAACLPWAPYLVHNLWRYHAPLFPFGPALWPGGEALWPGQQAALADFMAMHGPLDAAGEPLLGWRSLAALPWALVTQGTFASPAFDGALGILPAAWAGISLWHITRCSRSSPGPKGDAGVLGVLQGYIALRLLVWLSSSWQARLLIGPLWAMALVVVLAWPWGTGRRDGAARGAGYRRSLGVRLAPRLALVLLVTGTVAAWGKLAYHLPWPRAQEIAGTPEARRAQRLLRIPPSALCDAPELRGPGRTLMVWTQRLGAWCLQDLISDSYDEAASLFAALNACPGDPGCTATLLQQRKITHLLVHEAALADAVAGGSDPTGQARAWAAFVQAWLTPVRRVDDHTLYALSAPPRTGDPHKDTPSN